jgi:hypothetical protein
MRSLVVSCLVTFILSVGIVNVAGAFESPVIAHVSAASLAKSSHMATLPDWLLAILRYFGIGGNYNGGYNNPKGSVPIPGTLLIFGLGFGGLMAWRAIRP